MPPPAIVEADIANIDTINEVHNKIALVVVGEVETVFSRRHDVIGADGAHENSADFELFIQFVKHSKSPHIYSIYSFESPCKKVDILLINMEMTHNILKHEFTALN